MIEIRSKKQNTLDFSSFGYRKLNIAADLLKAVAEGKLPDGFEQDGLQVGFNTHSGCVFLTNSEYQVAMFNGDKLELWYTCPSCGHKGFLQDMKHNLEDDDCREYLMDIGLIGGEDRPLSWGNKAYYYYR